MNSVVMQMIQSLITFMNPSRYTMFVDLPTIGNSLTIPPAPQCNPCEPYGVGDTENDMCQKVMHQPQIISLQTIFTECLWPSECSQS